MQRSELSQSETTLSCDNCGNDQAFDTVKTYFHKVVLDGAGLVESSRVQSDLEGEELDITCRKCEAPVRPNDPAPLYQRLETLLEQIESRRHDILDLLRTSTEISMEAAEDLGVALCAITDAINEVRKEMEHHELYPNQNGNNRHAR